MHFISFFNSNAIYIQYGADGFVKGTVEYPSLRTLQARICRESPFTNPSWIILENKVDATHRTLLFRRTGVGRAHKYGSRDGVPGGFSGQSPEPSERRLPLFYLCRGFNSRRKSIARFRADSRHKTLQKTKTTLKGGFCLACC